eukprot:jgi/Botrbrau1/10820/Bobra.0064s0023.2
MPDNKTVYTTDDGTNVGFFMFKSDKPGPDFSSGTMYCLKGNQTSDTGGSGGTWDASWIKLAHGNETTVWSYIQSGITFSQIFNYTTPDRVTGCPPGFVSINAGHDDGNWQCLQLMPGMEMAATFLETRRYCAYLGGTTEFTKWEGLTYDAKRSLIYTSMSSVQKGMTNYTDKGKFSDKFDQGGPNDLRVAENICGCVFYMTVDPKTYNVTTFGSWLCGNTVSGTNANNKCDLQALSNPDNIYYDSTLDTVFVGEDTDNHQNDMVWAIDPDTKLMSRIATTPYGAEATSVWLFENLNGWSYLMMDAQHPYGESDQDLVGFPLSTGAPGWVGYLGPFKASDLVGRKFVWPSIVSATTEAQKHTVTSINKVYAVLNNNTDYEFLSTGKVGT